LRTNSYTTKTRGKNFICNKSVTSLRIWNSESI